MTTLRSALAAFSLGLAALAAEAPAAQAMPIDIWIVDDGSGCGCVRPCRVGLPSTR